MAVKKTARRVVKKSVKKTPVKKTPVKKTPVKKTPVKKTPVKKTPVKKTPVKKTPVKKTVQKTPVRKAVKKTSVKKTPVRKVTRITPRVIQKTPVNPPYIPVKQEGLHQRTGPQTTTSFSTGHMSIPVYGFGSKTTPEIDHYNQLSQTTANGLFSFSGNYGNYQLHKNLSTTKIFSFALFVQGEFSDSWAWKYLNKQLEGINQLLNLQDWKDHGIIWFLQDSILEHIFKSDTYKQFLVNLIKDPRVSIISYQINNIDTLVNHKMLFYVTVARYYPITYPKYDCVTVRDAHSTLPREKPYNYDYMWYKEFNKSQHAKYMFYEGPWYRPKHYRKDGIPQKSRLAATVSFKKDVKDMVCVNVDVFKQYFSLTKALELAPHYGGIITYGVDEWIISDFSKQVPTEKLYIVGIYHLLYVLFPPANPMGMQYKKVDNTDYYCIQHSGSGMPVSTYTGDVPCTLISINEYIKQQTGNYPTLPELFRKVSNLRERYNCGKVSTSQLDFNCRAINSIPGPEHIWDFLFNVHDYNIIDLKTYIDTYARHIVADITGSNFYRELTYDEMVRNCNRNVDIFKHTGPLSQRVSNDFRLFERRS